MLQKGVVAFCKKDSKIYCDAAVPVSFLKTIPEVWSVTHFWATNLDVWGSENTWFGLHRTILWLLGSKTQSALIPCWLMAMPQNLLLEALQPKHPIFRNLKKSLYLYVHMKNTWVVCCQTASIFSFDFWKLLCSPTINFVVGSQVIAGN